MSKQSVPQVHLSFFQRGADKADAARVTRGGLGDVVGAAGIGFDTTAQLDNPGGDGDQCSAGRHDRGDGSADSGRPQPVRKAS
jgi:hypothetical protein